MTRRFKGKYANLVTKFKVKLKCAICRRELKKSRFVFRIAICRGKRENCYLSRRMGKIAIPHVPRFPFVLDSFRSVQTTYVEVIHWVSCKQQIIQFLSHASYEDKSLIGITISYAWVIYNVTMILPKHRTTSTCPPWLHDSHLHSWTYFCHLHSWTYFWFKKRYPQRIPQRYYRYCLDKKRDDQTYWRCTDKTWALDASIW